MLIIVKQSLLHESNPVMNAWFSRSSGDIRFSGLKLNIYRQRSMKSSLHIQTFCLSTSKPDFSVEMSALRSVPFSNFIYLSSILALSRNATPNNPTPKMPLPFSVTMRDFRESHSGNPLRTSSKIEASAHISNTQQMLWKSDIRMLFLFVK